MKKLFFVYGMCFFLICPVTVLSADKKVLAGPKRSGPVKSLFSCEIIAESITEIKIDQRTIVPRNENGDPLDQSVPYDSKVLTTLDPPHNKFELYWPAVQAQLDLGYSTQCKGFKWVQDSQNPSSPSLPVQCVLSLYLKNKENFRTGEVCKCEMSGEGLVCKTLDKDWKKTHFKKAEAELKRAEAELKRAEAELKRAEAELKRAEAELKNAEVGEDNN